MPKNFWENDPVVAQQPAQPRTVVTLPKPPAVPSGYDPVPGGLRPTPGGPDDPNAPQNRKTTYRVLSPEEAAQRGLPPGGVYQISSEGNVSTVTAAPKAGESGAGSLDPKTVQGQSNIAAGILRNSGVDLNRNIDPVADLIRNSTSGWLQKSAADIYGGITGDSTDGMEAIGRLEVIGNDMVLQMSGGSLGAQISNSDREFIAKRMGDIANAATPADQRLAAWDQVKTRLRQMSGGADQQATPVAGMLPGQPQGGPGGGGGVPQSANPFDQTVDGQQVATGEFRTENDQETADQAYQMWKSGRSLNEIQDFVRTKYPGAVIIPNQETLDYARKKLQRGEEWNPFTVTRQVQQTIRQRTAAGGLGGYASGATSALTVGLDDELYGAAASMAGGDYETARDQFQVGKQASADLNPGANLAGQVTGGLIAAGIGGAGLRAVSPAAAEIAAANPVAANALYGAAYGAGESNDNRLAGAALGGAAGGVGGAVGKYALEPLVEAGANRLAARQATRASAPLTEGGEVIAAADRLNAQFGTEIAPIPADVGGPGIRQASGNFSKMPIGGALINRGADKLVAEAEKAKNAIAKLAGDSSEPEIAGENLIETAQKWLKSSKTQKDALYTRAEKAAEGVEVDLVKARQTADDLIAEAQQTPGGVVGLDDLIKLRNDLNAPSGVKAARAMRTEQKAKVKGANLAYTPAERRIMMVMDAADEDIMDSLARAGRPDVAGMFAEANRVNRERKLVIDRVLVPIIGRKGDALKSGEEVIAAIEAATKKNGARLGKLLSIMPEEDAGGLRATLINLMGKAKDGQQNAAGDAFSTESLLTRWSGMSDRAKGALFGGELRSALDDLAKVAGGRRDATKARFISPSGGQIGGVAAGASAIAGATVSPWLFLFNVLDAAGGAVLASPKIARMIAKTPSQPSLARKHLTQGLQKIAAGDKAIAATALGLQRQLMEAFDGVVAGAPQRLAADPSGETPYEETPTTAGAQR